MEKILLTSKDITNITPLDEEETMLQGNKDWEAGELLVACRSVREEDGLRQNWPRILAALGLREGAETGVKVGDP